MDELTKGSLSKGVYECLWGKICFHFSVGVCCLSKNQVSLS